MGIRGLLHHLDSYGERVGLQSTLDKETAPSERAAVIDGPALAYHIYNSSLAARAAQTSNALQAVPTYAEVGTAAVQWLQQLKVAGFNM